jgi:N-dimethylarginine dimethylaminohydrolase
MFATLRRVLVRRPDASFSVRDPARWNYSGRPDWEKARKEHDTLTARLRQGGAEVLYHDAPLPELADSVYVFDPAIITDQGAIILNLGKALRRGEEEAMARRLAALEIPITHRLSDEARAEGGDLLWLDPLTLAVGLGFRTNAAGLAQLAGALSAQGIRLVPVELPYHAGPLACLHLLSLISIVDERLAVVYPPLLSVPFYQLLQKHCFRLIEVPAEEFTTMGPNVLALAPSKCLMLEGNPITQGRLEAAGCEVWTYRGSEISLKSEGGPTCLTRPILRRD